MTCRRRCRLLGAATALVGACAMIPVGPAGSVPVVGGPSIENANQVLADVDAIASDDVWAVGVRSYSTAFMRHWDGTKWHPYVGPGKVRDLNAVDHVSSSDVWAAGNEAIIHWNGSSWRMSYNPPGLYHVFNSVAATGEDDVWAVQYDIGTGSRTVHWDGSTWAEAGELNPDSYYTAIDADQSDDVWAVGTNGFAEHWDGNAWTPFQADRVDLSAVAIVAPDDVWMAGDNGALPPHSPQAAMWHWDGHALVPVDAPSPGRSSGLNALTVVSPTDIWAVGAMTPAHGRTRALIEHWDGRHWHLRPAPNLSYAYALNGVSALTSDDAYGVGSIKDHRFHSSSVTLHWDGSDWTRVP